MELRLVISQWQIRKEVPITIIGRNRSLDQLDKEILAEAEKPKHKLI
jgi:hypothetical protein